MNPTTAPQGGLGHRSQVSEYLRAKGGEKSGRRQTFLKWSLQVPEPKGPLHFEDWRFQEELYSQEIALTPEVVVKKATQLGVSTYLLRWAMYLADLLTFSVIYVFPTKSLMYEFCLRYDERVLMADGTHRAIADLQVGDWVLSSDGERVLPDRVEHVWDRGIQPIHEVSLETGRRVRGTANHRLWTQYGWREIGTLQPGDLVAVPASLRLDGQPVDRDDTFLLALWLAEGSKTRAGFTVTVGNQAIRSEAARIAEDRGWDVYSADGFNLALTAKRRKDGPAKLLTDYGVRGMRTDTIAVPEEIMRADEETIRHFLATYVACDGCVGKREINVATASERMARDLQLLLARLGIPATVRSGQPKRPGALRSWSVNWAPRHHKMEVPGKPLRTSEQDLTRSHLSTLSNAQDVEIREARGRGAMQHEIASQMGVSQATVHRSQARRWEAPASEELRWARVRAIKQLSAAPTFDLTTENHHAFWVEGALTHNSDARIRPAILGSPYLVQRISREHVQNKGLKQIGTGFLYCKGSESTTDVQTVDADALAMDEYSELRAENIPDLERRIGASKYGYVRRVGVPDIPGIGLDSQYDASDRRRWFVRCGACNERQYLTYEENIDESRLAVVCRKCHKPLDVRHGEWVAEYPGREVKGYHLPKFIAPLDGRQMKALVDAHHKTDPTEVKTHWNKDLGEAYAPEEGRISDEALQRAQRDELPLMGDPLQGNLRTMGVDVASKRALNVRISAYEDGRKRAIWIGTVHDFSGLIRLFEEYDPHFACIDAAPDYRMSRAFAEKFPGRVWLCTPSGTQKEVFKPNPEMGEVTVNRTIIYDAVLDAIRQQRNLLPGQLPDNYKRDLQNIIRRHEVDEKGNTKTWYERKGPEDFAQTEMYDMVAEHVYLWLKGVEAAEKGETFKLEDQYDFERSRLDVGTQSDDVPEEVYEPGEFGEEEGI